ncbi:MAG TPA: hypothetical protein VNO30_15125 [Kofleriaceae bacterium]|nr:hypothetical protein [Kofleriaceae bacterium]
MIENAKLLWLAPAAMAMTAGCFADDESKLEGEGEGDLDGVSEPDASGEEAFLGGVYDVGIVPEVGYGCPAGSDEIRIRMDDEDDGNGNLRSGWIGKTRSDGQSANTLLVFCRVDGDRFRPLSTSSSASNMRDDYAVLKLGTTCPSGSQEIWRRFDNEDDGNGNYAIGVISPNVSDSYGTKLYFCLFRYASPGVSIMTTFPDLGLRYGVFAPSDFSRGLALGYVRTDDEDSSNANGYSAPSDALEAARRIIQPDTTVSHGATYVRFARVRCGGSAQARGLRDHPARHHGLAQRHVRAIRAGPLRRLRAGARPLGSSSPTPRSRTAPRACGSRGSAAAAPRRRAASGIIQPDTAASHGATCVRFAQVRCGGSAQARGLCGSGSRLRGSCAGCNSRVR